MAFDTCKLQLHTALLYLCRIFDQGLGEWPLQPARRVLTRRPGVERQRSRAAQLAACVSKPLPCAVAAAGQLTSNPLSSCGPQTRPKPPAASPAKPSAPPAACLLRVGCRCERGSHRLPPAHDTERGLLGPDPAIRKRPCVRRGDTCAQCLGAVAPGLNTRTRSRRTLCVSTSGVGRSP